MPPDTFWSDFVVVFEHAHAISNIVVY